MRSGCFVFNFRWRTWRAILARVDDIESDVSEVRDYPRKPAGQKADQ